MSADPTIYCLEHLTDYRQFERLCSDLMAGSGYPGIEPMGGSNDGGRDAIFRAGEAEALTIFAFSVRSDWRKKLVEDCNRIREVGHRPQHVVFACTSGLSSTEKDDARVGIQETYGWSLELYDLERIRVLLTGPLVHLVAQHPAIFCPPIFPQRGGLSIAQSRDTIVIDHLLRDHALATWLARRLGLQGYQTWCYGTAPLAGERSDDSVRTLIESRACQYLPILSEASIADHDFMDRCASAGAKDGLVLPCWKEPVARDRVPTRLSSLSPADFSQSWATGLRHVVGRLSTVGIQPRHDAERGRGIALREYVPQPVTLPKPERVFANVFRLRLPPSMLVCDLREPLSNAEIAELRKTWAFVVVRPHRYFAFDLPPAAVPLVRNERLREFAWEGGDDRDGKNPTDVAKELARRTLDVACAKAGLKWCDARELYYFPTKERGEWNQPIEHVDGRQTRVALTGEKQLGWGARASKFLYQLAPLFRVGQDKAGQWWVTVRLYVRATDLDGKVFEGKEIGRRRKAVGKGWWNKEWLARLLGVMQALRTEGKEVRIGTLHRQVVLETTPMEWSCPVALDVQALEKVADLGEEVAALRQAIGLEDEDGSDLDGEEEGGDDE